MVPAMTLGLFVGIKNREIVVYNKRETIDSFVRMIKQSCLSNFRLENHIHQSPRVALTT